MRSVTFDAMGTSIRLALQPGQTAAPARRLFEHVESVCSRFRNDSELSRLNASEASPAGLSPLLADVLATAQEIRRMTERLVDPAVGRFVKAWGYDKTFSDIVDLTDSPEPSDTDSWWHIEGFALWRSSDLSFDLGGVAKGWTADVAVELGLAEIVNAGGDLRSNHPDTEVEIEDPWGQVVATVPVGRRALATSSTTRRSWNVAGRRVHHLIDPRTDRPAVTPILSATAIADRAVLAEAAAKAVLILGESGLAWADEQDWIAGAIAVWKDGSVYATGGLEVMAV